MKCSRLIILIFSFALVACSGGGDGGGGGTPTDPTNPTNPETPSEGSIRSCVVSNGSGVEQFSNGVWGSCTVLACDSGFERIGNSCQAETQVSAPTNLAYPQNIALFRGQNVSPILPSYDGAISSFSIAPALPSGLSFSTATGGISGTAFIESSEKTHTVIGTGPGGITSTTIKVEIREPVPTFLSYTSSNATYVVSQEINLNNPTTDYEASITGYSISPALPVGLGLNTTTGIISGTPTGDLVQTQYTVTASYNGGSVQAQINLKIVEPPTSFSYPQSSYSLSVDETFPDIIPTYVGPVFPSIRFEVDLSSGDDLPNGVILNSSNGTLYTLPGSLPNIDTPARNVVIKAFIQDSPGVFISTNVSISVSSQPTTNLTYNVQSMLYRKLEAFPSNYPFYDGQAPDGNGDPTEAFKICLSSSPSSCEHKSCGSLPNSCAIGESKILPQGITFSSSSGRISGSSDFTVSPTDYIVTATYSANGGGTTSTTITISIVEALPSFTYNVSSISLRKNENLADTYDEAFMTPITSNGNVAITGWVIDKALPAGMNFNGSISQGLPQDASAGGTGAITGIPTEISSLTEYTISACNSDGCTPQSFYIRVFSQLDKLVTGKNHACVVFTDENDRLYCWGDNTDGQLGFVSSDVCTGGVDCSKTGGFVKHSNGSFLQNVREVSLGDNHSCALVGSSANAEHDLYCWGDNSDGQLGINLGIQSANNPQQVRRFFNSNEADVTDGIQVVSGGNSSCYLSPNVLNPRGDAFDAVLGNIFCWGENYTSRAEIVPGQSSLGFSSISYGVDHGCASVYNNTGVDPGFDGRVYCWGSNEFDKLGNTGGDSSSIQLVTNQSTFNDIDSVFLGRDHSCSLDSSSQLHCWGSNYFGQFGVNSGVGNFSTFFDDPVNTGITASTVFGNGVMTMIPVQSPFSLQYFGKTPIVGGIFTQASQSTPKTIQYYVESNLLNFQGSTASRGSSSEDFACSISSSFEVYCWGSNSAGKLGTGDETSQELPSKTNFDF